MFWSTQCICPELAKRKYMIMSAKLIACSVVFELGCVYYRWYDAEMAHDGALMLYRITNKALRKHLVSKSLGQLPLPRPASIVSLR